MFQWQTPQGSIKLSPVTTHYEDSIPVIELLNDALTHYRESRYQQAKALCETLLRNYQDYPDALHLLGVINHNEGKHQVAIDLINKAINIKPGDSRYYNDIGEAYRSLEQFETAMVYYQKAIELNPKQTISHNNLGIAYFNTGKLDKALDCYKVALSHDPDYFEVLNNLGGVYNDLGNRDEALKYYERALSIRPGAAEVYHNLTQVKRPAIKDDKTRAMQELLAKNDITESDKMHLNFALGKVYEGEKKYDKAFVYFHAGNELKRKTITFENSLREKYNQSLIDNFPDSIIQKFKGFGNLSERPVFIIGMPRSGTTLVEQIVSSHPKIHGAGELLFMQNVEQTLPLRLNSSTPYPACINNLTETNINNIANQYLEYINVYSQDALHITDKMPGNFQRVGLIKILFPKAKIIHCIRNPIDTCVSIYCNYFRGTHNYAYNLNELGQFYREYEKLMTHWKTLFDDIFEVEYESLTQAQEKISREIIKHIGVKWDKRCLEFYKNDRPVQTASSLQVMQPMYSHSVNRWKNYEKHLGPLLEALEIK